MLGIINTFVNAFVYSLVYWTVCLANETDVNIPFDRHFHTEPILPFNTWSTFRGFDYFGLKSSSPDSPAVSLTWFTNNAKDAQSLQMRHWCDEGQGLIYGWKAHNFNDFGFQQLNDGNYKLNTSFIKYNPNNWEAIISVDTIDKTKAKDQSLSLVIHSSIDRSNDLLKLFKFNSTSIQINGFNEYLGNFTVNISSQGVQPLYTGHLDSNSSVVDVIKTLKSHLIPMKVNETNIFALKSSETPIHSTLIAFQLVFKSESKVKIEYKAKEEIKSNNNNRDYDKELQKRITNFRQDFEERFKLKSKGFNESQIAFAQTVLSEMLGDIAYFNGNLSVNSPGMKTPKSYGPLQILSGLSSRPEFAHPYLWDEGFNNLLIQRWNSSLTLKIIKSWFNAMNIEGWIPREITIGKESIAKWGSINTQTDVNANPPSFLLTIDSLIRHKQIDDNYLKSLYPRLKAWFNWFNTSQSGQIRSTYRWRDRVNDSENRVLNPTTWTSGFDDIPRATHPTDSEYHLDLRCWMAVAADVMSRIAKIVNDLSGKVKYEETAKLLADNKLLESLHWSEEHKAYCDYGLHSTNVSIIKNPNGTGYIRKVWTPPKYQLTCDQLGYINIFPLIFGLIDANNTKLSHVLNTISNSSQMWSEFGLRSLSKTSFYYNKFNTEHEGPYWRGAIWINVNYLTLIGLRHYSSIPGPNQQKAQKIYTELRNALINNMYRQYQKSGFIWEQYDDNTGIGTHSHPFAGWSAVIVLVMAEEY